MQLEGRCAEPAGSHAAGGRRAQRFTGAPAVMACDEDRRWILNICGSVSRPGGDVADHHAARPAVRHRPRAGGVSESVGRERSETLIVDTGCERARPPTSASLPKSQKMPFVGLSHLSRAAPTSGAGPRPTVNQLASRSGSCSDHRHRSSPGSARTDNSTSTWSSRGSGSILGVEARRPSRAGTNAISNHELR